LLLLLVPGRAEPPLRSPSPLPLPLLLPPLRWIDASPLVGLALNREAQAP
jgi:hypothetical protein